VCLFYMIQVSFVRVLSPLRGPGPVLPYSALAALTDCWGGERKGQAGPCRVRLEPIPPLAEG